ncbi:Major facilitator superfamily domain general substrate transporter [Penicillium atrosanguineum]|uniref:Major facilitator superfamily domain general substrate transporter n=1 Tax=Penicillium atrosanguineum TaxID=1132637 RepID=A0A9W9H844_9EURO|nr:Major facilitator superfamily domain general substrate transporter [Penicillium atrosanguineum]KAJ5139431.1 Major facilitator superfamily domain general substrate transporter [Penicillium atrosanguineum]KAJ5314864.1 Major facilitator superfamily domain general substrate transporter [Penicillium atrosanguineum]
MAMTSHQAIVIGAGPGGLATLAALCDAGIRPNLWIDKTFEGGRLNTLFREISSLFGCHIWFPCVSIIQSVSVPNAVTILESMDRDRTYELSSAGDMVCMLVNSILKRPDVQSIQGEVERASLKGRIWTVSTANKDFTTKLLFCCTGS